MIQSTFHGILVDLAFTDRHFPETFALFARKFSGNWTLYGIDVPRLDLEQSITRIQAAMRVDQPFYSHLYDDETVVVIFKDRVFRVNPHISSWKEVREYGFTLNIPAEQLDFWPNRFQDEIHYFTREEITPDSN